MLARVKWKFSSDKDMAVLSDQKEANETGTVR